MIDNIELNGHDLSYEHIIRHGFDQLPDLVKVSVKRDEDGDAGPNFGHTRTIKLADSSDRWLCTDEGSTIVPFIDYWGNLWQWWDQRHAFDHFYFDSISMSTS